MDTQYELFELPSIEHFPQLLKQTSTLKGLNVTIPYKQAIIPYLDGMEDLAKRIGAVNVIKFCKDGQKIGYNSDCIGFSTSLQKFIPHLKLEALILGTGGASKAVAVALENLNISFQFVSRLAQNDLGIIAYDDVTSDIIKKHQLIINTTPLGMHPKIESAPNIPYKALTNQHYLYDLVYNPTQTSFMTQGLAQGAHTINGLEMLHLQAEAAWEIWNT